MGAEMAVVRDQAVEGRGEDAARVFERPVPARRVRKGFAGFTWGQLGLGAVLAGMAMWSFWLTGQVRALGDKRIVAIGLSGMVNEFVAAEARSGNGPDQVQADTQRFMVLLQQVLAERASRGETVIVGEAIVAGSAPDVTAAVRQEVGRRMVAGRNGGASFPGVGGGASKGSR